MEQGNWNNVQNVALQGARNSMAILIELNCYEFPPLQLLCLSQCVHCSQTCKAWFVRGVNGEF